MLSIFIKDDETMMTVKDLWQLSITKNFSVAAGNNALHKTIESVEILDFEFVKGVSPVRDTIFNPNSLVLSSLLFAKKSPELLMDTIKKLMELKVSALAYKPVIFKELPQDVLDYANEQGFPILRFGGDEFFEDIIIEVTQYRKEKHHEHILEKTIHHFIKEEVTEGCIQSFLQQINKTFEKYVSVASLHVKDSEANQWMEPFFQFASFLKAGVICKYRQGVFVFFTDKHQQHGLEKMIDDWLGLMAISHEDVIIGYSRVHLSDTKLHLAVREAHYASVFARIGMKSVCHYEQLASERILIELYRKDVNFAKNYVKSYLGEVLDNDELLDTAVTFVLKKGNVKEVAAIHFCHPNTIRYRMTKVRQLIDVSSNEYVFYEHLSMAIKLYLLDKEMERYHSELEIVQK